MVNNDYPRDRTQNHSVYFKFFILSMYCFIIRILKIALKRSKYNIYSQGYPYSILCILFYSNHFKHEEIELVPCC